MSIETLILKNFRNFSNLKLKFNSKLTVLVGVNGSGKTAVLDALALTLNRLMAGMKQRQAPGGMFKLPASDLRNDADSGTLSYEIKFSNSKLYKHIFKKQIGDEFYLTLDSDPSWLNFILELMNLIPDTFKHQVQPIFAYYGAKRSIVSKNGNVSPADPDYLYKQAFDEAFSPTINFSSSLSWFAGRAADEAIAAVRSKDLDYVFADLQAVRKAVAGALLGDYSEPFISGTPPRLYVTAQVDGMTLALEQLSDGYQTMLALVMDLSRRMAVLNGKSPAIANNILETPGIVLIDEIELHLHPSWQQTVLPVLLQTFPNIQFIVTTHSPQILTSIEPQYIRILRNGQAGRATTSSYGAQSWRVLEEILNVPSRPMRNKAKISWDEYLSLIEKGEGITKKALKLRSLLDNWFDGDPALTEADMLIERQERLKAKKGKANA